MTLCQNNKKWIKIPINISFNEVRKIFPLVILRNFENFSEISLPVYNRKSRISIKCFFQVLKIHAFEKFYVFLPDSYLKCRLAGLRARMSRRNRSLSSWCHPRWVISTKVLSYCLIGEEIRRIRISTVPFSLEAAWLGPVAVEPHPKLLRSTFWYALTDPVMLPSNSKIPTPQ